MDAEPTEIVSAERTVKRETEPCRWCGRPRFHVFVPKGSLAADERMSLFHSLEVTICLVCDDHEARVLA